MQNSAFECDCECEILGVRQAAWNTRFDDEVSLHFNAFF